MKNEKVSFQNTRVCPPKKMASITAKWSIKGGVLNIIPPNTGNIKNKDEITF